MGQVEETLKASSWLALCALGFSACAQSAPPANEPSADPVAVEPEGSEAPEATTPALAPSSEPPNSEPQPEGQLTGVGEVGSGSGKPCSVKDDNGPLPGGNSTTSGCDPGEICRCESKAGYSCSGVCVK
ncbi:MAG: hypothetical protein AB7K71_14100 [Polyangiaceae bacterium]